MQKGKLAFSAAKKAGAKCAECKNVIDSAQKLAKDPAVKQLQKNKSVAKALSNAAGAKDPASAVRAAAQLVAVFDPSGVSSLVAAFTYLKCEKLGR